MRTFTDQEGRAWQAALLSASYGNIALIFSPEQGNDLRQQPLDAENMVEAQAQLEALDDDALCAMLSTAATWDPAAGGF